MTRPPRYNSSVNLRLLLACFVLASCASDPQQTVIVFDSVPAGVLDVPSSLIPYAGQAVLCPDIERTDTPCSAVYRPVCGFFDDVESNEVRSFNNACMACSFLDVRGYVTGTCESLVRATR